MVHRSRGHAPAAHKSGPGLVAGHALYHAQAGTMAASEQQLVTVCQCNTFLDPYPSGQSAQWRSMVGALQHYCRVCNTQLNSCKQARIHVAGKKHEKRLAYLKFSLESSCEAVTSGYTAHAQYVPASSGGVLSSALPTVYSVPAPQHYPGPPPCPAPAYYYPAAPPSYPAPMYHYEQGAPPAPPPPTSVSASLTHYAPHTSHASCTSRRGKSAAPGGVMSPSLTSGFSGSGDCKSTETCSLLSVASYSSATPTGPQLAKERQAEAGGGAGAAGGGGGASAASTPPRHMVNCEVCHLPFPSRAVLEHHLMGSRHARRVKAETVLRQLQENGAEFRATEATGDIRCEVCEVSVNSSHQLQAHMTGHKHKMRCARQGVAPNKTILTPASSTAPSTTPSEASAPVRSYSILVGRPQFGSRPNLYKGTAATGRGGGRGRAGAGITGDSAREDRHRASRTAAGALSKLSKCRKVARPRFKTELSVLHGKRLVKSAALAETQAATAAGTDSTTESDEPGTSKQKPQLVTKKQESGLDKQEAGAEADGDESDEAKESEADPEPGQLGSSSPGCGSSDSGSRYSAGHVTKAVASQTEPLRRLSVDGCELGGAKQELAGQGDSAKEASKEPRRRSVSASYSQSLLSSSGSNNNNNNYHCNLCQISVNSQSQLAQHMNSNKHRRLSVSMQSHMTGAASASKTSSKAWSKESLAGGAPAANRECNVREIPMLSMFLQRLHQHHYFPPIRDDEDGSAETHR